jgi:hypothetical protein
MAFEHKEGSGTLFPNDYHQGGDTKPTHKGKAKWRGETVEVALWPRDGGGYSMKIQEPRQRQGEPPAPTRASAPISQRAAPKPPLKQEMDDEIPF